MEKAKFCSRSEAGLDRLRDSISEEGADEH